MSKRIATTTTSARFSITDGSNLQLPPSEHKIKNTLTIAALAMVVLGASLAANAPAKAQVVFESIYTQPANMVDGYEAGARDSSAANYATAPVVTEQRCQAGTHCERRHGRHS